MTTFPTDNSDNGDILRSITWQYDKAEKLVGVITLLKEAFDSTTKDFFDSLSSRINIDTADEFGLSVLGKTLGITRPTIVIEGEENRPLNLELYRKIIKGRTTLLNSSATMPEYIKYLDYVSDGKITVGDGLDMGLTFTVADNASEDIKYLNENFPDVLYVFPSGVRSATHSDSLMFGLSNDGTNPQDTFCGGLDESGFNWRLTPKGNWQ